MSRVRQLVGAIGVLMMILAGAVTLNFLAQRTPQRVALRAAERSLSRSLASTSISNLANATALSPSKVNELLVRNVEKQVEISNKPVVAHRAAFIEKGWKSVVTFPPDAGVERLDPQLLVSREQDFQNQLQTVTFHGEALDRVRDVALNAPSEKTRTLAIEALARSAEVRAQEGLIEVYRKVPEVSVRREILTRLRFHRPDSLSADFLAGEAHGSPVPELRQVAAVQLAVGGLAINARKKIPGIDPEVINKVPSVSRPFLESVVRSVLKEGP